MLFTPLVFWSFALLALLGALGVLFAKNPIHAALALILVLLSTAGLYGLQNASFVAIMQVLVYAGAIMVLFVFVIMLLNVQREELILRRHAVKKAIAAVLALGIGAGLITQLLAVTITPKGRGGEFGSLENIGAQLFSGYMLPFELLSLVLLVAIVGAVMIAKKDV